MKKVLALAVVFGLATTSANAAVLNVTSADTVGLPGFTTYTFTANLEAGDPGQVVGFDLSQASGFGVVGPVNQVRTVMGAIGSLFGPRDNATLSATGGNPAQDTQFLVNPAAPALVLGDMESSNGIFGAVTNLAGGSSLSFLQVVASNDETVDYSGNFTFGVSGGFMNSAFSGSLGGVVVDDPMLVGDPVDGSPISLQSVFDDRSDALPGAIMLSNGTGDFNLITGLSLGLVDPLGVFDAQLNGDKVDLFINGSVARSLPGGTMASAELTVMSDFGDLTYTLTATVPEPSTFGLGGLALAGLAGLRRRFV